MNALAIAARTIVFLSALITAVASTNATDRPTEWAQPLSLKGVPNVHQVAPGLYRSAQPTEEGMKNLEKFGIRTVIDLRAYHDDKDEMKGTRLQRISIPMNTWGLAEEHVIRFLQAATDTNRAPILVHCQHGADRTGTMCAVYRMTVQGWPREAATREMTEGGFGFHVVWGNLIEFLKRADVDAIRRKAGIAQRVNAATLAQPSR